MNSTRVKLQESRMDLCISLPLELGCYACYRDVIRRTVYLVPDVCGSVRIKRTFRGKNSERWVIQSAKLIHTIVETLGVKPHGYVYLEVGRSGIIQFTKYED